MVNRLRHSREALWSVPPPMVSHSISFRLPGQSSTDLHSTLGGACSTTGSTELAPVISVSRHAGSKDQCLDCKMSCVPTLWRFLNPFSISFLSSGSTSLLPWPFCLQPPWRRGRRRLCFTACLYSFLPVSFGDLLKVVV